MAVDVASIEINNYNINSMLNYTGIGYQGENQKGKSPAIRAPLNTRQFPVHGNTL